MRCIAPMGMGSVLWGCGDTGAALPRWSQTRSIPRVSGGRRLQEAVQEGGTVLPFCPGLLLAFSLSCRAWRLVMQLWLALSAGAEPGLPSRAKDRRRP